MGKGVSKNTASDAEKMQAIRRYYELLQRSFHPSGPQHNINKEELIKLRNDIIGYGVDPEQAVQYLANEDKRLNIASFIIKIILWTAIAAIIIYVFVL